MSGNLVWAPPVAHATVWRNPPEALLTSLQPRQISTWRQKNSWADAIEMIIFTDDDPPQAVKQLYACVEFAPRTGALPHLCVNAPALAREGLRTIRTTVYPDHSESLRDAARDYKDAVIVVSRALQGVRCAWIQPESDHSLGACLLAREVGMCVAYSARPMIDSIGTLAAAKCGVNVKTLGSINSTRGQA